MTAVHHRYATVRGRRLFYREAGPADIAGAVLFALTNTFLTGQTLHIDGGAPLT